MEPTTLGTQTFEVAKTGTSRRHFLQKTYNHLLLAIILFIAVEVVLFRSGLAMAIGSTLASNWIITLGGFMLVGWIASRYASTTNSLPMQYFGLGLFVLAEALVFTPLLVLAVYFSDASVLSSAIFTTVGIFLTLTLYVHFTKANFNFLAPFLGILGIGALVAIVGSILFSVTLGFYFSVAMAVFAGAAVLYDTSKVLREFNDDQYVAGALQLFASVAMLFYYILTIFASRD